MGLGRYGLAWVAACCAIACSFDTSNSVLGDADTVDLPDASEGQSDAIDPGECPEAIHIEVQVNGQNTPPASGQPYARTLIGDTVELSAAGTCTQTGTIQYTWTIEPGTTLIGATALPNLTSRDISVFSLQPELYTARLRVSDGAGGSLSKTIFAFTAEPFVNLPPIPGTEIKALSTGAEYLWLGGKSGAYRSELAVPGTYLDVSGLYGGEDLPNNIAAILEAADGELVWFGTSDATGEAYRLNLADDDIAIRPTIAGSKTNDISGATSGVRYGTDKGVALAANDDDFTLERMDRVRALGFGAVGAFGGDDKLYPLPESTAIDVFGGNNKITGIADDDTLLWVAGDGKGVASLLAGAVQTIYTVSNSNLISNSLRRITRDSSGDIWATTQAGVSRFKKDRQVWVPMGSNSGLDSRTDVKAIAIDDKGGRRAVYVGGNPGLSVMQTP